VRNPDMAPSLGISESGGTTEASENSNTFIRLHLLSMRCHAIIADHMRKVLDPFRFLLVVLGNPTASGPSPPFSRENKDEI
jgi:hypothetical protein